MAVAVGVGAVLLRLPRLGDPFWQDEVASARILREPNVARMLGRVVRTESTPPLWYALGWGIHHLGVSLQDVRLLSALCGGVLAGLVVVVARRVVPLMPAVVAGIAVAVGGQFALAGRELRAYALLALLCIVFAFALEAQLRRRAAVGLALVTAAGLLTHYFFAFTVAAGLVWLWLEPQARAVRTRATGAVAAGCALAAPWLPYALRQYRQDRFAWIGPFDGRTVVNTALNTFTPLVHGEWGPAVFVAVVLLGAWRLAHSSPLGRLVALLAVGPIAGAALAWLAGVRVYADRNLIGAGAFVAVCAVGASLALAPRARLAAVVALGCLAVASFAWEQTKLPTPYSRIAGTLVKEGWRPGDPVLVFGSPYVFRSPLEWYLPQRPVLAVLPLHDPACRIGYVVAGRSDRRLVADDVLHGRTVGDFLVARARLDDASARVGGSLLGTARAQARCGVSA